MTEGWSRSFDDPIALPNGGSLLTLRDAGVYIVALPPREAKQPNWQTAMQLLISAAERGGIVMLARIAMVRALSHGKEEQLEPRRKPAPRGTR